MISYLTFVIQTFVIFVNFAVDMYADVSKGAIATFAIDIAPVKRNIIKLQLCNFLLIISSICTLNIFFLSLYDNLIYLQGKIYIRGKYNMHLANYT